VALQLSVTRLISATLLEHVIHPTEFVQIHPHQMEHHVMIIIIAPAQTPVKQVFVLVLTIVVIQLPQLLLYVAYVLKTVEILALKFSPHLVLLVMLMHALEVETFVPALWSAVHQ